QLRRHAVAVLGVEGVAPFGVDDPVSAANTLDLALLFVAVDDGVEVAEQNTVTPLRRRRPDLVVNFICVAVEVGPHWILERENLDVAKEHRNHLMLLLKLLQPLKHLEPFASRQVVSLLEAS